uniref:Reverse transcriptase domain-containing protein n=1 Tax=Acrobeloides nanus TaxID=290746 RepID=A0A914C3I3_9BILA
MLPIVSKIAEFHFFTCLYPKINGKLSQNQFGFRNFRSTTDALLYFEHLVMIGFDSCKKKNVASRVAAVFLDIKKAFDFVPHAKLMDSLQSLSIPTNWLKLLSSYLENRHYMIRVGEAKSRKYDITSGVPQGREVHRKGAQVRCANVGCAKVGAQMSDAQMSK